MRRVGREGRRVDVEWTRANVAVDDSSSLVGQPREGPSFELLW